MSNLSSVLSGAVAMASLAVTLFFLKFWRQTWDTFFLLFALAFGIDALARVVLGLTSLSGEFEPFPYCTRLITFALIISAIVIKNRVRGK
ncbi:DUF5985 family protein [Bradyrhizobium sp. USDA 10063]